MKKRIRILLGIFLILLILTGCTFSKDRKKIISQLTKHEVIGKKWKLVAETSKVNVELFADTESYDYIYKTKDDEYNVVRILDNEEKYTIEVDYDVYYYTKQEIDSNTKKEYTKHIYESPRKIKRYYLNPEEKDGWFKWKLEELSEEEKDNTTTKISFGNTGNFKYELSNSSVVSVTEDYETNQFGRRDYTLTFKSLHEGEVTLTTKNTQANGEEETESYLIRVNERLDVVYEKINNRS